MTFRGLFVGVGCIVLNGVLAAQAAPNLAGSWELDREKTQAAMATIGGSAGGGSRGGGAGGTLMPAAGAPSPVWTIAQTADVVAITRTLADGSAQKFVYKLAGESVNTNARTTLTTRSRWESGKLVTEGTQVTATEAGAVTGTFKETRWLASDGSMHVETTRSISGNGPTTSVQVFARTAGK